MSRRKAKLTMMEMINVTGSEMNLLWRRDLGIVAGFILMVINMSMSQIVDVHRGMFHSSQRGLVPPGRFDSCLELESQGS
jgi:hypothetical protein